MGLPLHGRRAAIANLVALHLNLFLLLLSCLSGLCGAGMQLFHRAVDFDINNGGYVEVFGPLFDCVGALDKGKYVGPFLANLIGRFTCRFCLPKFEP